MSVPVEKFAQCDPIWSALREEAEALVRTEPALASSVHATVLAHGRLEDALSYHLAKKVGGADLSSMLARDIFQAAMNDAPEIGEAVRADLSAVFERDPACDNYLNAFLFYKGFLGLQCHRIAHFLWQQGRTPLALFDVARTPPALCEPGRRVRFRAIDAATFAAWSA